MESEMTTKNPTWPPLLVEAAGRECPCLRPIPNSASMDIWLAAGGCRKCIFNCAHGDTCDTCAGTGLKWAGLSRKCTSHAFAFPHPAKCVFCHGTNRVPVPEDQMIPAAERELEKLGWYRHTWSAVFRVHIYEHYAPSRGVKNPCRITAVLLALEEVGK